MSEFKQNTCALRPLWTGLPLVAVGTLLVYLLSGVRSAPGDAA